MPGFGREWQQEHRGIIRRVGIRGRAYVEATVPKVAVILRKAYEQGADVMRDRFLW